MVVGLQKADMLVVLVSCRDYEAIVKDFVTLQFIVSLDDTHMLNAILPSVMYHMLHAIHQASCPTC